MGGPFLWFVAGVVVGMVVATFAILWWLPPEHVLRWERGANGEKATAEVLSRLEREGWVVKHNLEKRRGGDTDHLVTGPKGVFLLETKHLQGKISVENGVLTTRQLDDEDQVFRNDRLRPKLLADARAAASQIRTEAGERAWVQAVVVVWGEFDDVVESGKIAFVPGRKLESWLRSRPAAPVELEFTYG
jgi:Nuclease-related domain